jgi:AcrR family transcriptional regulator
MNDTLKRDRLIEAAKIMFYQQGVMGTTLADIAQQAQVPLGNIYYHFRTKDALVEAVIQAHLQELQSLFAQLDRQPDPRQRLLGCLQPSVRVNTRSLAMAARMGVCLKNSTRRRASLPPVRLSCFRPTWSGQERSFACSARRKRRPRISPWI